MRDLVKSLIDAADPMDLLAMGAPDDEYDAEIDVIVERIQYDESIEDVIDTIDNVFETYFSLGDGTKLYMRQGEVWREAATTIVNAKEVDA